MNFIDKQTISKSMLNYIVNYYLELSKEQRKVTIREICRELEITDRTIRRFIDIIIECGDEAQYKKLHELVFTHTTFTKNTELYEIQQKVIREIDERKKEKYMTKEQFKNMILTNQNFKRTI